MVLSFCVALIRYSKLAANQQAYLTIIKNKETVLFINIALKYSIDNKC